MKLSLLPHEAKFFDLFEQNADKLVEGARALLDLMDDYQDIRSKIGRISNLEHECDSITHQIMGLLHRTFVTPLDREDIQLIAQRLDDVMDFIEGAAMTMLLYRIDKPTHRAHEFAASLVEITLEVNRAMLRLRYRAELKKILEHCVEINRLENEVDQLMRASLSELFDDKLGALDVIKWREVYQMMEDAADRCEDVANVLEGVVLKHG